MSCLPQRDDEVGDSWAIWLDLWSTAVRHPQVRKVREEFDERWRETIRQIVRAGQASGEFESVSVDDFAVGFSALLDGFAIQIALDDPVVDARRCFRAVDAAGCTAVGVLLGRGQAAGGAEEPRAPHCVVELNRRSGCRMPSAAGQLMRLAPGRPGKMGAPAREARHRGSLLGSRRRSPPPPEAPAGRPAGSSTETGSPWRQPTGLPSLWTSECSLAPGARRTSTWLAEPRNTTRSTMPGTWFGPAGPVGPQLDPFWADGELDICRLSRGRRSRRSAQSRRASGDSWSCRDLPLRCRQWRSPP